MKTPTNPNQAAVDSGLMTDWRKYRHNPKVSWSDLSQDQQNVLAHINEPIHSFTSAADALDGMGLTNAEDGEITDEGHRVLDEAIASGYIVRSSPGRFKRRSWE